MTKRVSELVFERDTAPYVVNGERLVSVTEALAIAGLIDFSGVPVDRLEEAALRGTMAHGFTAMIDRGEEVGSIPEAVQPYVAAYEKFRADTNFEAALIEHPMIHDRWKYAGTLDRFGPLNGSDCVLDLKCGATIPRWVGLQLAGYELVLERIRPPGSRRRKRFALRLKPDGTYSLQQFNDFSDRADFLSAVRIAQWQLKHGGYSL